MNAERVLGREEVSLLTARKPRDRRPEGPAGGGQAAPATSVPEGALALPGPSRPGSPSSRWNAPGGEWNDAGAGGVTWREWNANNVANVPTAPRTRRPGRPRGKMESGPRRRGRRRR